MGREGVGEGLPTLGMIRGMIRIMSMSKNHFLLISKI